LVPYESMRCRVRFFCTRTPAFWNFLSYDTRCTDLFRTFKTGLENEQMFDILYGEAVHAP